MAREDTHLAEPRVPGFGAWPLGYPPPVPRSNYSAGRIALPPGRYRCFGYPPMTGLRLDKWIEITESNPPGTYGAADLEVARCIPNLERIEDDRGETVWPH
jgi:hypothetical protein